MHHSLALLHKCEILTTHKYSRNFMLKKTWKNCQYKLPDCCWISVSIITTPNIPYMITLHISIITTPNIPYMITLHISIITTLNIPYMITLHISIITTLNIPYMITLHVSIITTLNSYLFIHDNHLQCQLSTLIFSYMITI